MTHAKDIAQYYTKITAHAVFGTLPYGHLAYQQLQRHFGGLKNGRYESRFNNNAKLVRASAEEKGSLRNMRVMEVGTGRIPTSPVGFWLVGAASIDTYDVTSFLDSSLTTDMLHWIRNNERVLSSMYGDLLEHHRLKALKEVSTIQDMLELCSINYYCPMDAGSTSIGDDKYDIHASHNVLEHIPKNVLFKILTNARRVLQQDGIAVHLTDHTDHWGKKCRTISPFNFLRFSEATWNIIANNKYAFLNRLRVNELVEIFKEADFRLLKADEEIDTRDVDWVKKNHRNLESRFHKYSPESIAVHTSLILAKANDKTNGVRVTVD